MEDKLNSVHKLVKEIQETVKEMRLASQGYMSHNKASNIALKIAKAVATSNTFYSLPYRLNRLKILVRHLL